MVTYTFDARLESNLEGKKERERKRSKITLSLHTTLATKLSCTKKWREKEGKKTQAWFIFTMATYHHRTHRLEDTDRHTGRDWRTAKHVRTKRETDNVTDRWTDTNTNTQTSRYRETHRHLQTDKQTQTYTDRKYRLTDTPKQTNTHTHRKIKKI